MPRPGRKGIITAKTAPYFFLAPMIAIFAVFMLYPVFHSLVLGFFSFDAGEYAFVGLGNYVTMLGDPVFWKALGNTFIYLLIQVPVMVILSLVLGVLIEQDFLKLRSGFRISIFLPSVTALVAYALVFKLLLNTDYGMINHLLNLFGLSPVDWLHTTWGARFSIILAITWRWTGYNMVFYLAGLQNIDYSIYEAARIDGASPLQQFVHLTIPLLKPTILLTAIMSTSGTLQLFDESVNLTAGGPGKATMTLTHYIYNISFVETPKFNYAAALSVFILVVVAVLSAIQMKVGDKRD